MEVKKHLALEVEIAQNYEYRSYSSHFSFDPNLSAKIKMTWNTVFLGTDYNRARSLHLRVAFSYVSVLLACQYSIRGFFHSSFKLEHGSYQCHSRDSSSNFTSKK